tara:strand:+ start:76 stop:312 length:237 start_codon:yes stop_codon:yes gene_type:complete
MYKHQKRVTAIGTMGSKSKLNFMKSYKNTKKEAGSKEQKRENAQDIISKSSQKNRKVNCLKGSGSSICNLKSFYYEHN